MLLTISDITDERGITALGQALEQHSITDQDGKLLLLQWPARLILPYSSQSTTMDGNTTCQVALSHPRGNTLQFAYMVTINSSDMELGPLRDALLTDEHTQNALSRIMR